MSDTTDTTASLDAFDCTGTTMAGPAGGMGGGFEMRGLGVNLRGFEFGFLFVFLWKEFSQKEDFFFLLVKINWMVRLMVDDHGGAHLHTPTPLESVCLDFRRSFQCRRHHARLL